MEDSSPAQEESSFKSRGDSPTAMVECAPSHTARQISSRTRSRRRSFSKRHGKEQPSSERVNEMLYPMHVMRVSAFIERYKDGRKLEAHQQLVHEGAVVEWDGSADVVFISHEWVGHSHCDPEGEQTRQLVATLEKMLDGTFGTIESSIMMQLSFSGKCPTVTPSDLASSLETGWLWLDYISVPQPLANTFTSEGEELSADLSALHRAVLSIPAYIETASMLVVFTPNCEHVDRLENPTRLSFVDQSTKPQRAATNHRSWRLRGWCRVEFMGAWLSPSPKLCLTVRSSDAGPYITFPMDALTLAPGLGNFTCCACNHVIAGQRVECDKPKIREVLERMWKAKCGFLLRAGRYGEARYFLCAKHMFLRGLPPASSAQVADSGGTELSSSAEPPKTRRRPTMTEDAPPADDDTTALAALKVKLQWRDGPDDAAGRRSGWTLLMWATLDDNAPAVRALLQLATAWSPARRRSMLSTRLSSSGAMLENSIPRGMTLLICAMLFGSPEIVGLLLDAGVSQDRDREPFGALPLHYGAMSGNEKNCEQLLTHLGDRGIDRKSKLGGLTALHFSAYLATHPNSVPTIVMLLKRGADATILTDSGRNLLHSLCLSSNCDPKILRMVCEVLGPNFVNGRIAPTTRRWRMIMLIAGATASRGRTRRKKKDVIEYLAFLNKSTPLHCAAYSGDATRCRVLLEEGADPTLLNARRRDAAAICERAGFHTLTAMFNSEDVSSRGASPLASPKLTSSASPKLTSSASMPTHDRGSVGSLSDISGKLLQLIMPENGPGSSLLDRLSIALPPLSAERSSERRSTWSWGASDRASQYDAAIPEAE